MVEITAAEQTIEKWIKKKNEDSLWDIWYNIKITNISSIGVPEGEEREKEPEKILEVVIAENFPNTEKEIVNQVQEVQRFPGRINPRIKIKIKKREKKKKKNNKKRKTP